MRNSVLRGGENGIFYGEFLIEKHMNSSEIIECCFVYLFIMPVIKVVE